MSKYIRDLQVLAGISSVVMAAVLVLAISAPTRESGFLSVVLLVFLATLAGLSSWFAVRARSPAARANMRTACRGGLMLGGVALAVGYIGPLVFFPSSNCGPLLGILCTGPLGFVVGVAGGLAWRRCRRSRATSVVAIRE